MTKEEKNKKRESGATYRVKLRHDAFMHYGDGTCAICHCSDESLLELHHLDGGGNKERNGIARKGHHSPAGWRYYQWLRTHGYPSVKLQVLCKCCHRQVHEAKENNSVDTNANSGGLVKLVKEDDEPVNFVLVEPAKNHKPWTPKFLTILSPLNNSKASRSASGLNGYDDEDLLSFAQVVTELHEPREAVAYVIKKMKGVLNDKDRFDPDEVLDYFFKLGKPNGWVSQNEFIRLTGSSREFIAEIVASDTRVNPFILGHTMYYDPEWVYYVIAYKFKKSDERKAASLAARKAYHATSSGPLKHIKYSSGRTHDIVPPTPSWLTQARSEGLMTSGDLAKAMSVSIDTIRHWSDIGILKPTKVLKAKRGSGIRMFTVSDIDKLKDEVKEAQKKRLSQREARKTHSKSETLSARERNRKYHADLLASGKMLLKDAAAYTGYSATCIKSHLGGKDGIKFTRDKRYVIIEKSDIVEWKARHDKEAGDAHQPRKE